MVQFGRDNDGSRFAPKHQSPPNYFSRKLQFKILVLVFLFMSVLMLMGKVRDPKYWQWMWQLDGASSEPVAEDAPSGPVLSEPVLSEPVSADSPRPQKAARPGASPEPPPEKGDSQPGPSTARAQLDGWTQVLGRLSKEQRLLLQQGMWQWRRATPFAQNQRLAWAELVQRLDENWADYHSRAYRSISEDSLPLTDAQKQSSVEIIEASKSLWSKRQAALVALAQSSSLSPAQQEELTELQQVFDQRAWAQVKDNRVLRSADTEAWMRCWDKLESLTLEQWLAAKGPITFAQLYSQSNEFRGQLIKVKGIVWSAYRTDSHQPQFGIDGYIVLGLQPGTSGNSPIVIYCRELPAGFPAVAPADSLGQGQRMSEEVEVTGYFFKRWLHRSKEGMTMSPLVLGKVTQWQPSDRIDDRTTPPRRMSWGTLATAIGSMAMLATLLALWAYRGGHWSSKNSSQSTRDPASLPSFNTQPVHGNVTQRLSEIEDDDTM